MFLTGQWSESQWAMHNYIQLRRIKEVRGQSSPARVKWKCSVGSAQGPEGIRNELKIMVAVTFTISELTLTVAPQHFEVSIEVSMLKIQDILHVLCHG